MIHNHELNITIAQLLLEAPSGVLLDNLILQYRPKPGEVTNMPSDTVLEFLNKERNLYSVCLEASVTLFPQEFFDNPALFSKRPVRRSLALNPNITKKHRTILTKNALECKDVTLALHLMKNYNKNNPNLVENIDLINLFSFRTGQKAGPIIGKTLAKADRSQIENFLKKIHNKYPEKLSHVLYNAFTEILDNEEPSTVESVVALFKVPIYAKKASLPPISYFRVNYGSAPYSLVNQLLNESSETVLFLQDYITISYQKYCEAIENKEVFALLTTEEKKEIVLNSKIDYLSPEHKKFLATILIEENFTIDNLYSLCNLYPEWHGSVKNLIEACCKL